MISIETAKALKGLEWKPKMGDWYYFGDNAENLSLVINPSEKEVPEGIYFAPRLDQLLAWIEMKKYIWSIDVSATNGDKVIGYAMSIATDLSWRDEKEFRADSPEDAAAQALLWILKEGAWT
jgi:hypothetical protein